MADENKPEYNLEFITQALGLLPIKGGQAAINIGALVDLEKLATGDWSLRVHGDTEYSLTEEDMAELQQTIRARAETAKLIQKETIKQNMKLQAEAVAEMNRGVAPGVIVPPHKRFRQQ